MKNIKLLLILVIFGLVVGVGVSAKEKDEKKDKTESVVATTTATTTEPVATSTPAATTTSPTATTTVATSTPPSIFTPIINFFTPKKNTEATTTPVAGRTGQVNNTLGDGFFSADYYASGAFSDATTRSLKLLGFLSAVLGIILLGGKAIMTRYYS